MKIILIETIEKVGNKGEVVNVKRGFARNYLLPRKYAIVATPHNLKKAETLKKNQALEEQKKMEELKALAQTISALHLTFIRKTDEHGSMYGSVSENDILHELKTNQIEIPKTSILLEKHIKQLGDFDVPIRLHKDIVVNLHITIQKENTDPESE